MFDDLDDICDTIDILEGKTPLTEAESPKKDATHSTAAAPSQRKREEPPQAWREEPAQVKRDEPSQVRREEPAVAAPAAETVEDAPEARRRSGNEARPEQGAKEAVARCRPTLTLEQVLILQRELYDRFASRAFQSRLKEIEAMHGKAYEGRGGDEERAALFLTVHREVLPKFGFEGSQAGFLEVLHECVAFNSDIEFCENRDMLNQLLGLQPTPNELARVSGAGGKGKGKGKLLAKGKGKGKGKVSVGEVLSLITRDSPWAVRRPDDTSTSTTAGTEATSEDPEGM